MNDARPSLSAFIFAHSVLALAAAVVLWPVLWVTRLALSPAGARLTADPSPIPPGATLEHFQRFIHATDFNGNPLFWYQLGNSLVVSGAAAIIGVLFAVSAAWGFSRYRFAGRDAGMKLLLVSQMFPAVVTAVPLMILLHALGLFGTTAGLVLIYATGSVPFCIWMLKGYFDSIPRDLDEAARLQGASHWTIFREIMLPLVRPGIAICALFSFMTAWNEFIMASIFLDDATSHTLPVTLQRAIGGFDPDWPLFAAGSLLLSIPVVLVFFLLQRHLVGGLSAGAVKG